MIGAFRLVRLARTQTSAVSEPAHNTGHYPLWNEVKFIDQDPHCYTRRVKEAIHIALHPKNINRDSGMEIPEEWMITIKKHNNRRTVRQRTAERTIRHFPVSFQFSLLFLLEAVSFWSFLFSMVVHSAKTVVLLILSGDLIGFTRHFMSLTRISNVISITKST